MPISRRNILKRLALIAPALQLNPSFAFVNNRFSGPMSPIATGPFEATRASLKSYKIPAWFRDAKFGIWAHWGPQCEPEQGDWYAREMYFQDSGDYKYHSRTSPLMQLSATQTEQSTIGAYFRCLAVSPFFCLRFG